MTVVAIAFCVILLIVGVLGFVVPADRSLTSGAPAYNVFHLASGAIGLGMTAGGSDAAARAFLIGFGIIDLYQAVASRAGWFPKRWFRWRLADDVLHVVVGAALVVIGLLG